MGCLLILLLIALSGCAAPPKLVTLSELALSPDLYKNTTVQFMGLVKDNKYFEDRLGAWQLFITDGESEIYCFKNGSNLILLRRGVRLAEEAKKEEGIVTVIGELTPPSVINTAPFLEIQRLSYKDKSVNVEIADYPRPYYSPYHGHRHHHFARHFFHRHRRFRRGC